jgi:hypothetical protein
MELISQLLELAREVWGKVIGPFFSALWAVALSGPTGIITAVILFGVVVFAYQEARR